MSGASVVCRFYFERGGFMTEKQQARFGSYPVYCQTASGYCCKEKVFLGYYPLNVAVRCDICGRWSRCEPGRVEVANSTANWGVASGGAITNTAAISFTEATGDWGTVTYFFIATSSTGTTILGYGDLGTAKAVTTGDTVSFAVGDLDITVS